MIKKQIDDKLYLKKVRVKEIPGFIQSAFYQSLLVKPISGLRAKSYYHNPRASEDDFVLYLLFETDQLVGFRTILPDIVAPHSLNIKFGWCSGNWVAPEHRRKGFSKILLDEAYADWDNKLMYTNFARESHLLYNKTNYFKVLSERTRIRFYGKVNAEKLLKNRYYFNRIKPVLPIINIAIRAISRIKKSLFKPYKLEAHSVEVTTNYPKNFIAKKISEQDLFARNKLEFKWADEYPWLSADQSNQNINYPFSLYEPNHQMWYITLKNDNKEPLKLILSSRGKNLKLLYNFSRDQNVLAAKVIINFCYTNDFETFSLMDNELAGIIIKLKKPFIARKKSRMGIYSTFEVNGIESYHIQDGDGDYMFT